GLWSDTSVWWAALPMEPSEAWSRPGAMKSNSANNCLRLGIKIQSVIFHLPSSLTAPTIRQPPPAQLKIENDPGTPGEHGRKAERQRQHPQPHEPGGVMDEVRHRGEVENPGNDEHVPEDVPATPGLPETSGHGETGEPCRCDNCGDIKANCSYQVRGHSPPRRIASIMGPT